jgi:hypothetical protein
MLTPSCEIRKSSSFSSGHDVHSSGGMTGAALVANEGAASGEGDSAVMAVANGSKP